MFDMRDEARDDDERPSEATMRRRDFLCVLGGAEVAWPIAALAQRSKMPRIGYLGYSTPGLEQDLLTAFQKGLRDLGYIEGKDIVIEYRSEGKLEELPKLAAELVGLNVDVIVTLATPGALAAKKATNTIPVVVAAISKVDQLLCRPDCAVSKLHLLYAR